MLRSLSRVEDSKDDEARVWLKEIFVEVIVQDEIERKESESRGARLEAGVP